MSKITEILPNTKSHRQTTNPKRAKREESRQTAGSKDAGREAGPWMVRAVLGLGLQSEQERSHTSLRGPHTVHDWI